jgi:hypothetical protein
MSAKRNVAGLSSVANEPSTCALPSYSAGRCVPCGRKWGRSDLGEKFREEDMKPDCPSLPCPSSMVSGHGLRPISQTWLQ